MKRKKKTSSRAAYSKKRTTAANALQGTSLNHLATFKQDKNALYAAVICKNPAYAHLLAVSTGSNIIIYSILQEATKESPTGFNTVLVIDDTEVCIYYKIQI